MRNGLYYLLAAILLVCLGMTLGCASPQVSMPVGVAAIGLANGVEMYTVGRMTALQMRRDGKIPDDVWEDLKAIDIRAKILKSEVEKALLDAKAPIDWEKVILYTQSSVDLLIKLGAMAK